MNMSQIAVAALGKLGMLCGRGVLTGVDAVDRRKRDEQGEIGVRVLHPV